jgi:hypothetical protein
LQSTSVTKRTKALHRLAASQRNAVKLDRGGCHGRALIFKDQRSDAASTTNATTVLAINRFCCTSCKTCQYKLCGRPLTTKYLAMNTNTPAFFPTKPGDTPPADFNLDLTAEQIRLKSSEVIKLLHASAKTIIAIPEHQRTVSNCLIAWHQAEAVAATWAGVTVVGSMVSAASGRKELLATSPIPAVINCARVFCFLKLLDYRSTRTRNFGQSITTASHA